MPLWMSIENVASGLFVALSSNHNGAQLHLEVNMTLMLLLLMMMMMMRGKRACAIFSPSSANFWSVYAQNLLLA